MPTNSLIEEGFLHHQEGRLKEAEDIYRRLLEIDADNIQALQLFGALALGTARADQAVEMLGRAKTVLKQRGNLEPQHASLFNNLGMALQISGRSAEAVACFMEGLQLDPNLAQLHMLLGGVLMEQGDFVTAAHCYEKALGINPNLSVCFCDLGTAYVKCGRPEDAIAMYQRFLLAYPLHREARIDLAQVLRRLEKYDEAISLLLQLLSENPADLFVSKQLGLNYMLSSRAHLAADYFQRVLMQNPNDAETLLYLADVQQLLGNPEDAKQNYRRSVELRPIVTINAVQSPPDFKVLLLFAPGAGNIRLEYLVDHVTYENNLLHILPNLTYDVEALRAQTNVVFNLIADVDQGGYDVLVSATELIDRLGKPTINHPQKIIPTDRESIAALLAKIPHCLVPKTRRYTGGQLREADFNLMREGFSFPLLVRLAGTHGGDDFEQIYNQTEFHAFISRWPAASFYLIDYIDYRSADGFFRKYRFNFIGEEILPYHLAIDKKWKVHHASTDMVNHQWMQQEEKYFLENPHEVFGFEQFEALRLIQQTVDLEFFGIDCALNQQGQIVVFEVNAAMLVHQRNQKFPYKNKHVQRIKLAFDAMIKHIALAS